MALEPTIKLSAHIKVTENDEVTHFACTQCHYKTPVARRRDRNDYGRQVIRLMHHIEEAHGGTS